MIDVYVSVESDVDSTFLCKWPANELDDLIPTLRAWELVDNLGHEFDGFYGSFYLNSEANTAGFLVVAQKGT